jgi:hypothetical protein
VTQLGSRWAALDPDERLLAALERADHNGTYQWAGAEGTVHDKRNWSNRFADTCAQMVAPLVRQALGTLGAPADLVVLPTSGGSAEPPVILGEGSRKRIDVAVVHQLGGLRIDLSFKGLNFRDLRGDHYDKNLTGRTYELENEVRQVRQLQPSAYIFALYWMPLPGASDKTTGESSFTRTLLHLRARLHKGPPGTVRESDRIDGAGVALYAPTDVHLAGHEIVKRGVLRCADAFVDPPRRGRPRVDATLPIDGLVENWVRTYLEGVGVATPDWAQAETDILEE